MKLRTSAIILLCFQYAFSAVPYKLEELCAFPPASFESGPWAQLVFGPDGALYGTTYAGGSFSNGSVFRVTTSGVMTNLVSFANTNGANPRSALMVGPDGALYGECIRGGIYDVGTVFRVTTNGEFSTLIHFDLTNGAVPSTTLVTGSDNALYGTTLGGIGSTHYGTVFRLTIDGMLTTLARFDGTNGNAPYSNLILTSDGSIYGTTASGGGNKTVTVFADGLGNVFGLSPAGVLTNLATFDADFSKGFFPHGKLVLGTDGAMYGTAHNVFRVTTNGELSVVAKFDTNYSQFVGEPQGGLELGSDGAFYGTTHEGGDFNVGSVFRVTMNGFLTNLASFGGTNGANPHATLAQGSDGVFYGTTSAGGSFGGGNVFRLTVFSHLQSVNRMGNAWKVTFSGVPNENYRLLRSTNISGPWDIIANITLDADGHGHYLDADPPPTSAFYQTVTP